MGFSKRILKGINGYDIWETNNDEHILYEVTKDDFVVATATTLQTAYNWASLWR